MASHFFFLFVSLPLVEQARRLPTKCIGGRLGSRPSQLEVGLRDGGCKEHRSRDLCGTQAFKPVFHCGSQPERGGRVTREMESA